MRVYCGDLNIHIGELIDVLLNDDLDRYKECVEHVDNPIISNRRSMNKAVNAVGRKLPQMCFDTGLTVTNGRLCNDRDGNLTFCTNKGRRVNKGNNKITELRTILQRESQNS
jgi:hypothetical protein